MSAPRRDAPVLVIHGGTGPRPTRARCAAMRHRLRAIGMATFQRLQTRSALESVVDAVQQLEDDPLFNAGTGSALQRDGRARMSAAVMDGARRQFAAVLNIERVRHPVLVARMLLDRKDRILAGAEATRFARSLGLRPWDPVTRERLLQWRHRVCGAHGTVGAVALNGERRLAAATSTGGKGFEQPGRVSDSGLPVGTYATPRVALSCTGIGEEIIDEGVAVSMAQRVEDGASLAHAVALTMRALRRRHRRVGFIALDGRGRVRCQTTLPVLWAIAYAPSGITEFF